MKLVKLLISLFLVAGLFSCATTGGSSKEPTTDVDTESADVKEDTKKMVEVEVTETFYYITKEMSYYGDGQIDTVTTYTYNPDYIIKSVIQTNEQEEVLESVINIIENNLIVKQQIYGFTNELNSYTVYEYDADGNVIKESLFDKEDKLQSINEYEYADNLVTKWITKGPNEGTLAITSYEYDKNGNNTKVEMKDAGGVVDGVIEKLFTDNLITEEKVLDSKGKVEKSAKYLYENGNLVEKVYFDDKNKKTRSESYEYDNMIPVPSKLKRLYRSGALEAYTLYEYDSNEVVTKMMVEE